MGKNLGANEGDIGRADSVCSQSRSGDAGIGNRLMDKGGEQEGGGDEWRAAWTRVH